MNKLAYIIPIAALCMGCSHKNVASGTSGSASSSDSASLATSQVVVGYNKTPAKSSPSKALPKATAFRMNGDYADNVAVSVGSDGRLTYFPDPSDISADSRPVDLGDGWWLNLTGNRQEFRLHDVYFRGVQLTEAGAVGEGIERVDHPRLQGRKDCRAPLSCRRGIIPHTGNQTVSEE